MIRKTAFTEFRANRAVSTGCNRTAYAFNSVITVGADRAGAAVVVCQELVCGALFAGVVIGRAVHAPRYRTRGAGKAIYAILPWKTVKAGVVVQELVIAAPLTLRSVLGTVGASGDGAAHAG